MKLYIKLNDVELRSNLELADFQKLAHLHSLGEIHVSISVHHGERVGFLPLSDIDIPRTLGDDNQLRLL